MPNNVSLLGHMTAQTGRLGDLRARLNELSRQITTGQIAQSYGDLGTQAQPLQSFHSMEPMLKSYQNNIDTVSNTMTIMNNAMSNISSVTNDFIASMQTLLQNDPSNIISIRQIAENALKTVQDMMNQSIDGKYLFAGSDSSTPPFVDNSTLNSNVNNQIQTWLASGSNSGLTSAVEGFSSTSLGFSATLADSGNLTIQIGVSRTVDYTVKADGDGFQNIVRALTIAANLPYPQAGDTATMNDFQTVMNSALEIAQRGVKEVDNQAQVLAGKFAMVKTIQSQNSAELNIVQTQISKMESADTTSAIAELQILQTQLAASYQVTGIVSQLSLVNYM